MKMTNGMTLALGVVEVGCFFGIGFLFDWRAGVAAFLGSMVMRIACIDINSK